MTLERWTAYQTQAGARRERYRVSIADDTADGRECSVSIGAFVYDPGDSRLILDTWTSKDFTTRAAALAWLYDVTGNDGIEWERQ